MSGIVETIILDEDYKQIFKPTYYIQYIFCMQPFNIKDNRAYQLNKFNLAVALIANVIVACIFFATVKGTRPWDESMQMIYFWIFSQYCHCFMLVTFLNFYQKKTSFKLLQELQEISRSIRNKEDMRRLKIMIWSCCGMIVMFYVFLISFKMKIDKFWHWARAFILLTTLLFEVKLMDLTFVLYFLTLKLRKWQKVVLKSKEISTGFLEDMKNDFQRIVDIFSLFKTTYQTLVLYHFIMTFMQSLVYIEIIILSSKTAPGEIATMASHVIGFITWIIKGLVIKTQFCIVCEIFYKEIEYTRSEMTQSSGTKSIDSENIQEEVDFTRFGKCIRRTIDTNFTKMTACGLFTVEAVLLFRLAIQVATYTIVLLQFALS